jgi:hypothetical protein
MCLWITIFQGENMEIEIEPNEHDNILIELLLMNSLNINNNYLKIPVQDSPEAENEDLVNEKVKAYVNSLKDSKRIIEILMERADSYL